MKIISVPSRLQSIPVDPGHALQIIPRQRTTDKPITWTGPGLVRVVEGAGLRFTVDNLPTSMDYQLVIRYEPEVIKSCSRVTSQKNLTGWINIQNDWNMNNYNLFYCFKSFIYLFIHFLHPSVFWLLHHWGLDHLRSSGVLSFNIRPPYQGYPGNRAMVDQIMNQVEHAAGLHRLLIFILIL